jgi:hypothetical protein
VCWAPASPAVVQVADAPVPDTVPQRNEASASAGRPSRGWVAVSTSPNVGVVSSMVGVAGTRVPRATAAVGSEVRVAGS